MTTITKSEIKIIFSPSVSAAVGKLYYLKKLPGRSACCSQSSRSLFGLSLANMLRSRLHYSAADVQMVTGIHLTSYCNTMIQEALDHRTMAWTVAKNYKYRSRKPS